MNEPAPIIYICYNRLNHIKKSINSIKKNKLSKKTKIIIFSDGPKNHREIKKIIQIRRYLKKITGFKSKKMFFRKKNFGTKKNVVMAINQVFKKSDRAIIIEDDLIVSQSFLHYMNFCLKNFRHNKQIWHINGWSYPFMKYSDNDINYMTSMNCWGWGTWRDRWSKLNMNENKFISSFSKKDIHRLNIYSSTEHWSQIIRNKNKTLSSWAIYWHASIFSQNGICVYPRFSLVKNIGFDGSGRMSSVHKYKSTIKQSFKNIRMNNNFGKDWNLINEEFKYYMRKKGILSKLLVYFKKIYFKVY